MNKMNKWEKTIKYINSKKIGTIFSRIDLIKYVNNGIVYTNNSVDNYRIILTHLDILEWIFTDKYKII